MIKIEIIQKIAISVIKVLVWVLKIQKVKTTAETEKKVEHWHKKKENPIH